MSGETPPLLLGGTRGRLVRPAAVTVAGVGLFVAAVMLALGLSDSGGGSRLDAAAVAGTSAPRVEIADTAAYGPLDLQDGPAVFASPLPDPIGAGTPASSSARPRFTDAGAVPGVGPAPAAAPASPAPVRVGPTDAATTQMLTLVNKARRDAGLAPLTLDPTLNTYAAAQTRWMVDNGTLCHSTVCNPAAVPRGRFSLWGENVGWVASPDVPALHRAFMESPTHRENLLRPEFAYVGLSWSQGRLAGRSGTYWFLTEQFGTAARG